MTQRRKGGPYQPLLSTAQSLAPWTGYRQTDRPATWAGVGFHFAPYGLMVLNVSRSEEVPGAVRRRAPEMTDGKVLCSRTAESRDPHPKPRGSPVLQP